MPLQVGIIGAGIGGLSAAIALRRTGAEVEVSHGNIFEAHFRIHGPRHSEHLALTLQPVGL